MKTLLLVTFCLFLYAHGLSQGYVFTGKHVLSLKKGDLPRIKYVSDISPELWSKVVVTNKERIFLDHFKIMDFSFYPEKSNYKWYYNNFIYYASVVISANCKDIVREAEGKDDKLTQEQLEILNTADLGTDIKIKIKYKYKNLTSGFVCGNELIEANVKVTLIPDKEAEYPGGFAQLTKYLNDCVINKIPPHSDAGIWQGIMKFTVGEDGRVMDAKISRTSGSEKVDQLLLEAARNMPSWKPALNANGEKVSQEFSIPLNSAEGC